MGFEEGPHLERVQRNDNGRWPLLLMGLGAALVMFATLRPWTGDSGPSRTANTAHATPSLESSAFDAVGLYPQCFPSTSWRVASVQQTASLKVRTAWPVAAAPLPRASAANTPTLFGGGVEAIGFCTPGMDELTRTQYVGDVSLWRRSSTGSVAMVTDAGVLDPELAVQGEVYLTPSASISADGTWPAGEYFFQVRPRGSATGTIGASSSWLALRLALDNHSEAPLPAFSPKPRPQLHFMQAE